MAKKASKISAPALPMGPRREPLEKAHGFRDVVREPGERDVGSARSIGPRRAARLISPTRDLSSRQVYRRMV